MDLVYSRANCSIALLDSVLNTETDVPALAALYEWGKLTENRPNLMESRMELEVWQRIQGIVSFLGMISRERWGTRAWVIQEALSAGSRMFLLFGAEGDWSSVEQYSIIRSDLSVSQLAVQMDSFATCVAWTRELFTQHIPTYVREMVPSAEDFTKDNEDHIQELFERLLVQFVHPVRGDAKNSQYRIGSPKRSCNAAAALSFLRQRENSVVSDRVSIFANMRDYDFRLDVPEISRRGYSLSVALLALALLNGDYSLLIPEVYGSVYQKPNGRGKRVLKRMV